MIRRHRHRSFLAAVAFLTPPACLISQAVHRLELRLSPAWLRFLIRRPVRGRATSILRCTLYQPPTWGRFTTLPAAATSCPAIPRPSTARRPEPRSTDFLPGLDTTRSPDWDQLMLPSL